MKKYLVIAYILFAQMSFAVADEVPTLVDSSSKVGAEKKVVSESEIPLNIAAKKNEAHSDSPLMRMGLAVSMMIIVGGAIYFGLRRYKGSNIGRAEAQIKVVTQHYLGPKKSLAIIRVAGESILIGVTDHNISMIKSLALLDEELPEVSTAAFASVLGQTVKADEGLDGVMNQTPAAKVNFAHRTEDKADDFAFGGIKDAVKRKLRDMRSINQ